MINRADGHQGVSVVLAALTVALPVLCASPVPLLLL